MNRIRQTRHLAIWATAAMFAVLVLDAQADPPPASPLLRNSLLPPGWDPLEAGNAVLERLISVTAPHVKGAHDAEFELVGRHAYVVSTVNDVRPGHSAADFEYVAMSIVNLDTLEVEVASLPIARSGQAFVFGLGVVD